MTLTLSLQVWDHRHHSLFDDDDLPQTLYEKARRACLDRRVRCQEAIIKNMRAHGLPGIFINPERALVSSEVSKNRRNPRKHTALYRVHLPAPAFETIARSLAEGVGIAATISEVVVGAAQVAADFQSGAINADSIAWSIRSIGEKAEITWGYYKEVLREKGEIAGRKSGISANLDLIEMRERQLEELSR